MKPVDPFVLFSTLNLLIGMFFDFGCLYSKNEWQNSLKSASRSYLNGMTSFGISADVEIIETRFNVFFSIDALLEEKYKMKM